MKTIVPFGWLKPSVFLILLFVTITSFSQTIPELVFKNASLVPGSASAGQDGAKYLFSNVGLGLDATLEIKSRSASNVVVNNIDITSTGWDKALQPEVGINSNVGPNQNWWVKFHLTFYQAGTSQKKTVSQFIITSLDIDGNNGSLREWVEMDKVKSVSLSQTTSLTDNLLTVVLDLLNLNNNGEDHKITGASTDYPGIDTSTTSLMATYTYENKDQIDFYLGGKTGSSGNSSAMRMNSLWFKQFNLNPGVTLPVDLIDFSAMLNKSKVDLKWITASEKNVNHFEIERSTDGTNYSLAAVVFAYGNTTENKTYTFSNDISNVQSSIVYYRLRTVDIDGKSQLSQIRIIRVSKQSEMFKMVIYPNPVRNELRVTVPTTWQGKKVMLEIFNQSGQKVKALKSGNASQTEIISVNDLVNGFYLVKATCGAETAQQKVVKN